jgi:hypothetical protein
VVSADETDAFVRRIQRARAAPEAARQLDAIAEAIKAARPLYECLARVGIPVDRPAELVQAGDPRALPCLLDALRWLDHEEMRIEVIIALSARWAQPEGARALIAEFDKTAIRPETEAIREMIASAASNCVDYDSLEDVIRLATDTRQGEQRIMFIVALGRYRRRGSTIAPILLQIMREEPNSIGLYAVKSLDKLGRGIEGLPWLLEMQDHGAPWLAKEADRLLKKIGSRA